MNWKHRHHSDLLLSTFPILHVIETANFATGGLIEGIRQITVAHRSACYSFKIVSCDRPGYRFLPFPWVTVQSLFRCVFVRFFTLSLIVWLRRHRSHYGGVVVNGI